jgi:phage portal protein BeeE
VNSGILNKVYNMKEELVEVVARDGATFTKNPNVHGMYTYRDDIILPTRIVDDSVGQEYLNPWTEITATSARERAAYFQYGWIAGPIPVPFGKKEIIWIEAMKRTDDHYGYSPVQILAKNLQMLLYMIESDLEYYNDNNVPKGIIGLDDSDADEIEAFKDQWYETQRTKDEFGNWKKIMNKVPITNKTPKFTRIEFSASEMQLIEKQRWYTKMVWASFGVTPTELGYTEDSKGSANQIVQSKVFRKKAINPILRNLEAKYNINIVSEFGFFGSFKTYSGNTITIPNY